MYRRRFSNRFVLIVGRLKFGFSGIGGFLKEGYVKDIIRLEICGKKIDVD